MKRLERVRKQDGKKAAMDLQVSTASDLPALGDALFNLIVAAGTIAQVVQTGKFYTLDENGTWYDTDGNAAS